MNSEALVFFRNVVLFAVALAFEFTAYPKVLYDFTLNNAVLKNRNRCDSKIGTGANLVVGQHILKGKCQVASESPENNEVDLIAPKLWDLDAGVPSKFLSFQTSNTVKKQDIAAKAKRDRSELALMDRLPFDELRHFKFKIRIPSDSSSTNNSFYLMQMWQCAGESPIAGIVLNDKSSLQFITRSLQKDRAAEFNTTIATDVWYDVLLSVSPSTEGKSLFVVRLNGEEVLRSTEEFGFPKSPACIDDWSHQSYRLKFGIYKYHEGLNNQKFEVHFKDLKISEHYKDLQET